VLPLVKRLDEVTGTMLLPALADGQSGFVLDAKWTSKQWHTDMPATPKALPMPELAVVLGVSDAALLQKAMGEYRQIFNELIVKLQDLPPPVEVPTFQIPEPKTKKVTGATLFFYPIPARAGLDEQVVPTAGLSKTVAVLTLSHGHAERLLASKPLKVDGGPLADSKRRLVSASYLNWPGLIDALTPWVEYGARPVLSQITGLPADEDNKAMTELVQQVRTVLEVLKCFRGRTSVSYFEEGVLVTHAEAVFQDLPK
jgi:hypothetical protein